LLLRNLYGNEHENWRQTTESIFVVELFSRVQKCRAAVDARGKQHEGKKSERRARQKYFERKCLCIVTKMSQKRRDNIFTANLAF
jgi:hypothetical protein